MENQETIQPNENAGSSQASTASFDKEKVLKFYKQGLPDILKTFFRQPISGTASLLSEKTETGFMNSLFLMVTTAILYIIIPYIMMGEYRSQIGGFGVSIKIGITVVILMLIISLISFGVKSISGKPVFKNELLAGALSGIPLSILIIFLLLIKMFVKVDPGMMMMGGGLRDFQSVGIIGILIILYVFLMLVNILQQSFKAGGTDDALAWYLSPIGVLLAFYVTQKLVTALLM